MKVLLITLFAVGASTVCGVIFGLILRNIPHRYHDGILGGAAGIMLGAAVLGLIGPAANCPQPYSLWWTVAGTVCGAVIVSLFDRLTPHLHRLAGLDTETHQHNQGVSRILLFITALALHKIPEGLAAGVSFGTGNVGDVMTVAGGITLQNIPEAMVIVTPLLSIGVSMRRTVMISLAIGGISMTATLLGYVLVSYTAALLPFILALAGGAMLYVISDEMIPETHAHGFEKGATFALIGGFLLALLASQLFA